jgi:hypothetical protein
MRPKNKPAAWIKAVISARGCRLEDGFQDRKIEIFVAKGKGKLINQGVPGPYRLSKIDQGCSCSR